MSQFEYNMHTFQEYTFAQGYMCRGVGSNKKKYSFLRLNFLEITSILNENIVTWGGEIFT